MGLANPGIRNHGSVGKDIQFLQKYLTIIIAMLTDTSGLDPSRLVVTVDGGWLGIEINLTIL